MNWTQFSIVLGIVSVLSGALWKAASAWTKKAIAIGERAAAEREKEREITELRKSHEKLGERLEIMGKEVVEVKTGLGLLTARIDERERARRDTLGIPVRSDGE